VLTTASPAAAAAVQSYLNKYDCLSRLKPGGVLVLNATWKSAREMEAALPAKVRRQLAALAPQMYVVDARAVADAVGLGKRINMVMQTGEHALCMGDDGMADVWQSCGSSVLALVPPALFMQWSVYLAH
jgi:hypothetical protein